MNLLFAKPPKRTAIFKDNTTTHAMELEKRKKSALLIRISNL